MQANRRQNARTKDRQQAGGGQMEGWTHRQHTQVEVKLVTIQIVSEMIQLPSFQLEMVNAECENESEQQQENG